MFTGVYEHTVDKKGRTSLPARFREELEGRAYISVGIDKNLVLYSVEHFEAMAREIGSLNLADPTARIYRRRMFNKAELVELDANGRFLIPTFLREEFGYSDGDKIIFAGSDDYIELWTQGEWVKAEEQAFHNEDMDREFALMMNSRNKGEA